MSATSRHIIKLAAPAGAAAAVRCAVSRRIVLREAAQCELVQFSSAFGALLGEFELDAPVAVDLDDAAWTAWHFCVHGESVLGAGESAAQRACESTAVLQWTGEESAGGWVYAGGRHCVVTLLLHREFMGQILQRLPGVDGSSALNLDESAERMLRLRLNSVLARAAKELVQSPFVGALRLVHLESKALELLCVGVQELQRRLDVQRQAVLLSRRDIARLSDVRAVLVEHPTRWLTISQLSRQFGLNQRKLKEGFKHLFGDTVFQFAQAQRMLRARRMIEEDALPIGHVAVEIGYESHASFTAAYKRYFGRLPRDARSLQRSLRDGMLVRSVEPLAARE